MPAKSRRCWRGCRAGRSRAESVITGRRRRCPALKRSVVSDIGPDVPLIVLPFARIGTVVSSPCRRSAASTWGLDQRMQRLQRRRAGTHLVGQRRYAEVNAFAAVSLALPVQRLVLAELLKQDHGQQISVRRSHRGVKHGTGAGGCAIVSHRRHAENFSRTVWITFQDLGMTSSVSVMSSPSFDSRSDPQHGQLL